MYKACVRPRIMRSYLIDGNRSSAIHSHRPRYDGLNTVAKSVGEPTHQIRMEPVGTCLYQ